MELKILGLALKVEGMLIGGISKPDRFVHLTAVRDPEDSPYIPAPSFKGRLRMILERLYGLELVDDCTHADNNARLIMAFFGRGSGKCPELGPTRLYFQDLKAVEYRSELKPENLVSRTSGKAEKFWIVERIYGTFVGSIVFLLDFEGIGEKAYKRFVKEILPKGFRLMKLLGIGRGTSRGYGRIKRIKARRMSEEERERFMLKPEGFEQRKDVEEVLREFL